MPNDTVVSQEEISKPTTTNSVLKIMHSLYRFIVSWASYSTVSSIIAWNFFNHDGTLGFAAVTNGSLVSLPLAFLFVYSGLT